MSTLLIIAGAVIGIVALIVIVVTIMNIFNGPNPFR